MAVALSLSSAFSTSSQNRTFTIVHALRKRPIPALTVRGCSSSLDNTLRTCKNCKTQFGGETKRKFERVYSGGTLNTPRHLKGLSVLALLRI